MFKSRCCVLLLVAYCMSPERCGKTLLGLCQRSSLLTKAVLGGSQQSTGSGRTASWTNMQSFSLFCLIWTLAEALHPCVHVYLHCAAVTWLADLHEGVAVQQLGIKWMVSVHSMPLHHKPVTDASDLSMLSPLCSASPFRAHGEVLAIKTRRFFFLLITLYTFIIHIRPNGQ